jgi:glyoxylase-like metal-dependent hydrolase (beta-lactamase superfamily II)
MPTLKAGLLQVTLFQQNCLFLWDDETKAATVIDPGGEVDRIREAVDAQQLVVEKILLTHGHIDHAGGAAELAEALGVKIEGPHEADAFLLDGLPEAGAEFGMDDARAVTPDRWLSEGDRVEFGPFGFDVLHCPGHTPGHVVFIDASSKFAVLGDVLFKGSIGRTDFPYGDHDALIDAIKTKLLPLDDDVTFFCGHGPPSTIGDEKRTNPFLA